MEVGKQEQQPVPSVNKKKRKRVGVIKNQQTLAALLKNPEAERTEYGGLITYSNYFHFSITRDEKRYTKNFHINQFPSTKEAEKAAKECLNKYIKDNDIENKKSVVSQKEYYIFTLDQKEAKKFNVKDYPNRESAFQAVTEYQKKCSAELNLDHKIPAINISSELKQYIAGFLDGDGCINLRYHKGYDVRVSFGQAEENGIPPIDTLN